jgi:hypothetical protein
MGDKGKQWGCKNVFKQYVNDFLLHFALILLKLCHAELPAVALTHKQDIRGHPMKIKLLTRVTCASVAAAALFAPSHLIAADDCLEVKGKILNTLHDPALGSFETGAEPPVPPRIGGASTVGVVALNGAGEIGKLKCALVGVAISQGSALPELGPTPNFLHTISCDDKIESPFGVVHSQLTFFTTGEFTGWDGACIFDFVENSIPVNDTGDGVFKDRNGGSLEIKGTLNSCTGSIDMKFEGQTCK